MTVDRPPVREPVRQRGWAEIRWRQFRNAPRPVVRAVMASLVVAVLLALLYVGYDVALARGVVLPGGDLRVLALAVYAHRVRQAVGALAVTMGGLDALVFTAGVGEHAAEVRAAVCGGLECLGLEPDAAANAACRPDADVATPPSRGRILVIATREDVTMLREVLRVLDGGTESGAGKP